MWIVALICVAALLAALVVAFTSAKRTRHPLMLQWGRHINTRPGLKDDHLRVAREKQEGTIAPDAGFDGWSDEPDVVKFVDYRYWLRLSPNFGVSLPMLGYWSSARGWKRPTRPWERS